LEQQCDPAGQFLLISQPTTGYRYLAHVEGNQAVLSQPLTGRHKSRGSMVECKTSSADASSFDEGYCSTACTYDGSRLRYFYSRYHSWTRDSISEGRERYWFDLDYRYGLFLTRSVSRLAGINSAVSSSWKVERYEERTDYFARLFALGYRTVTTPTKSNPPGFDTIDVHGLAKGPILAAGRSFNPSLAFSDFTVVHGKERWNGKADLSASAVARWNRDSLSLQITVKDDVVRLGPGIHSDHIELWAGPAVFSVSGLRQKPAPEDIQLMISMVDGKVLATVAHPENSAPPRPLEGRYETTSDGYFVEFTVPSALLLDRPSFSDYKGPVNDVPLLEGDLLPFTLVISDSDKEGQQKTLAASSNLKWGNPVTFGRILLLGDHPLPELNRSAAREEL
jgi:hypothetical protein